MTYLTGQVSTLTGWECLTPAGFIAELKKPVGEKLKAITDRGSDGCFTAKEEETLGLLRDFIVDETNPIFDRARAVYFYDAMMGMVLPPERDPNGIVRRWMVHGPQNVVEDFIETTKDGAA